MKLKTLNGSFLIEEQIKRLANVHWPYDELYGYFKKYLEVYQQYNLSLDYLFKYFRKPESQIDGTYVFLGVNTETNKVMFGRIYLPKINLWGKYQIEVRLAKFLHSKYEISDTAIDQYLNL